MNSNSKNFLVRPETTVFRADLNFAGINFLFLFSCCEISKLRQPTAAKFCTMKGSALNNPGPKFREALQKNFRSQKEAKFGTISDDFKVSWQIFPEWIPIFKIGQTPDRLQFLLR